MSKKYKIMLLSITVLLIGAILLGTSYSLWTTTNVQEETNTINVGCFKITFSNVASYGGQSAGDISLNNSYPITEEAGASLTPYMFNIKNECSIASNYVVNLETLNESDFNLNYLRVKFNDVENVTNNTSVIYNNLTSGNIILTGQSSSAKQLASGYLASGEDVTYSLRTWIDYDATTETENVMGKTWKGKVVVSSEAVNPQASSNETVTTSKSLNTFVSEIFTDGSATPVTNARYAGASANNYVKFNNENWRILGLYNNIIKIVKADAITDYVLNANAGALTVSKSVVDPETSQTTSVDYYDTLSETAKAMVVSGNWNSGSVASLAQPVASIETAEQTSTLTGNVGTITLSDYLYATADKSCSSINANLYGTTSYESCINTNYLNLSNSIWTLTDDSVSAYYSIVNGIVGNTSTTNSILPVVYLNSNVVVTSGNGTVSNPYIISLN